MQNFLLLSKLEVVLVVAMIILALFFCYVFYLKVIQASIKEIKEKRIKKTNKNFEDTEPSPKVEAPKQKNLYEEILDKVHQNRVQYYAGDSQTPQEEAANFSQPNTEDVVESPAVEPTNDLSFLDELSFDDDDADYFFDQDFDNGQVSDFKREVRRRRSIKRNQSIEQEINQCSDRIKAMLLLDVINKKMF